MRSHCTVNVGHSSAWVCIPWLPNFEIPIIMFLLMYPVQSYRRSRKSLQRIYDRLVNFMIHDCVFKFQTFECIYVHIVYFSVFMAIFFDCIHGSSHVHTCIFCFVYEVHVHVHVQ